VSDTCLKYQTFQDIGLSTWPSLFRGIVHTFSEMRLFYRTFLAFDRRGKFLALALHFMKFTLYLLFLFIIDLEILLKSFFCLLPLRIIFLEVLAKVNKMDLNFEISLSDVFLFGFEVLLMPKNDVGVTF
jgi:hypothetical protein